TFDNGKEGSFEQAREEQNEPKLLIKEKATDQAHIALGVRAFPLNDKRREILDLLATLLGAEKSSRMFQEVRDKLGLAYYIGTEPTYYGDVGYLATFAGVNIDNIDLAIKTILREYQRVSEEGVGEKELFQAKEYIKGRLLIELESSFHMARLVGSKELLLKERESLSEYFSRLDMITKEDICRVAKEIFKPEHLNLAIIGPFNHRERFTKLLNLDHR
ncbi:MAG: insulinase family protein, partial [Candidatus Portnoybacteria bacterium]|nr:insulinase family protein [Candidatus Portnoybacteria bacterium]